MGSYGLTRAGIAYPNKTRSVPDVVEASGQRLVEIPIAPDGRLDARDACWFARLALLPRRLPGLDEWQ